MRCRRRRRDVAAVAAVALCCCEPHASAEGPAGFELLSGHTLSDSEKCGDSNGKKLGPDDRCGNLNGGLKTGGEHTCKGSASGYAACVTEAAAACAGDPACFSFIVPSVGQPGTNWATYTASVGNAAPNKDWDVYHKSGFMPCTACPEGGTALPNPPNGYLMEWAQHCSKLSGAWEQGTTTKIFCGPPVAGAWGAPFLLGLGVACALYLAAGLAAGQRGSAGGGLLAGHMHYAMWLEVGSMVRDGVAFCQQGGGGGRRHGGGGAGGSGGYERLHGKGRGKSKSGSRG